MGGIPQQLAERVIPDKLIVAVGEDEDSRELGDSAHEEAKDIHRGLVRPVHILDPQNGGPDFPEFLQQSVGDTVAIAGRQGSSETVAHNSRQITKWA